MDPIYEAYINEMTNTINMVQFYLDFAQYVGANVPIDVKKYAHILNEFKKNYGTLYRVWTGVSLQDVKDNKVDMGKNNFLATTSDKAMIKKFVEDSDVESIVTVHSGTGIDVNAVLEDAIKYFTGDKRDLAFVKQVYRDNSYQKEVLLENKRIKILRKDIIGVWDPDEGRIIEPNFDK